MIARERTGRQESAVLQSQHLRFVRDQGYQDRIEFDGDGAGSGGHVCPLCPFFVADARGAVLLPLPRPGRHGEVRRNDGRPGLLHHLGRRDRPHAHETMAMDGPVLIGVPVDYRDNQGLMAALHPDVIH